MEKNWEKVLENVGGGGLDMIEGERDAIELIEEYLMKDDDDDDEQGKVDDLMWLDDIILDLDLDLDLPEAQAEAQEEEDPSSSSPPVSGDNKSTPSSDIPVFENENDHVLDDTDDDPLSKKRKRQLRNRDAAMRSRERKKIYVKDLETKSRYLEAECRRLGRLLQCCYAENQMLRFSLGTAFIAKPESAVLFLESLLLVSLVWLMVSMYLPRLPLLNQDAVPHASVVEKKELESAAPNGKGTKVTELWVAFSFAKSKRCRASRVKMKSDFDCAVLCF